MWDMNMVRIIMAKAMAMKDMSETISKLSSSIIYLNSSFFLFSVPSSIYINLALSDISTVHYAVYSTVYFVR
jgi:hypothetical protein